MQETAASEGRILLLIRLFFCFLVSRALFLLPLFLPLGVLSFWVRVAVKLSLCLAAALLICGPERSLRAYLLSQKAGGSAGRRPGYFAMVKSACVRVLRVAPFLILFLTASVLTYYSIYDDEMNFKAMRTLKNIGDFLKNVLSMSSDRHGYDVGCAALLGAAALFLILTAIWWHRDVPMDYGWKTKDYYARHASRWRKTTLLNLLAGLPAYLLWAAALFFTYRSLKSEGRGGLFNTLLESRQPMSAMLRNRELFVYLVLILLLVYLPCWCLRKWQLTRACAGGMDDAA